MLPQILKKTGLRYYMFCRPDRKEKAIERNLFLWRSGDGSEVIAFRPLGYGGPVSAEEVKRVVEPEFVSGEHTCLFYGVGNHGGGPTKVNLRSIHHAQMTERTLQIVFSSPNMFFEAVSNDNAQRFQW